MSCERTKYGFERQNMSNKNMSNLLKMTVCVHGIIYTRRKRDREKKYG